MPSPQRESSISAVQKLITTLGLSAIDIRHTPALYARYLKLILGGPENVILPPGDSPSAVGGPGNDQIQPVQPGATQQRLAFSFGQSDVGQEKDFLATKYLLEGDFWDNALLPGAWGMT